MARFDSDQIGPWTRWQGDLAARLLIVGQDWGGRDTYVRQEGVDICSPTNDFLRELLETAVGIVVGVPPPASKPETSGVFLTNAVLCLKDGGDNGPVRASCFNACRSAFLKPQIELLSPVVVVSVGYEAYKSTMRAFGIRPARTMREAVASTSTIRLECGSILVPQFHCGGLGQRNRSRALQLLDWKRVRSALESL